MILVSFVEWLCLTVLFVQTPPSVLPASWLTYLSIIKPNASFAVLSSLAAGPAYLWLSAPLVSTLLLFWGQTGLPVCPAPPLWLAAQLVSILLTALLATTWLYSWVSTTHNVSYATSTSFHVRHVFHLPNAWLVSTLPPTSRLTKLIVLYVTLRLLTALSVNPHQYVYNVNYLQFYRLTIDAVFVGSFLLIVSNAILQFVQLVQKFRIWRMICMDAYYVGIWWRIVGNVVGLICAPAVIWAAWSLEAVPLSLPVQK